MDDMVSTWRSESMRNHGGELARFPQRDEEDDVRRELCECFAGTDRVIGDPFDIHWKQGRSALYAMK